MMEVEEEVVVVACVVEDADGHVCAGAGDGAFPHVGRQEEHQSFPRHRNRFQMAFLVGPKSGNPILYVKDRPDQEGQVASVWVE